LYKLTQWYYSFDTPIDYSREKRLNDYLFCYIYKKDVIQKMGDFLSRNKETLTRHEKKGREEMIYVYNWLNEMTAKYPEEIDSLFFVYMCIIGHNIRNCKVSVKELKQSVRDHPFVSSAPNKADNAPIAIMNENPRDDFTNLETEMDPLIHRNKKTL